MTVTKTPESGPMIRSMSALLSTTFAPILWVVLGLLPEGLAILSGPPKIGKSWLVMNLCIAKATGGLVLGKFAAELAEVLLLSLEDNDRRLQGRLRTCLSGEFMDLSRFHATTSWRRLDQGGLEDLTAWLKAHPFCKLVVIDTIQKIKPHAKRRNGTSYENDYDAYGGLQRLALEYHVCILVIHHNRKAVSRNEDDPLEQISGSIGITGAMDTILMLRRPRGAAGAVLTVTGRDIAEAEYGLTFNGNTGNWSVTAGTAAEIPLGNNSREILDILRTHEGKAFKVKDLAALLGNTIPDKSLKTQCYRLAKMGIIANTKGAFSFTESVTFVTSDTSVSTAINATP